MKAVKLGLMCKKQSYQLRVLHKLSQQRHDIIIVPMLPQAFYECNTFVILNVRKTSAYYHTPVGGP